MLTKNLDEKNNAIKNSSKRSLAENPNTKYYLKAY